MKAIANYMTPQPWTVQVDDSLAVARQMFAEREIHHLPVLNGGELVGMLIDRDLHLIEARPTMTVEEAMSTARRVAAKEPLDEVVDTMVDRHADAVVVVTDDGGVAGIFTAHDALKALSQLLHQRAA